MTPTLQASSPSKPSDQVIRWNSWRGSREFDLATMLTDPKNLEGSITLLGETGTVKVVEQAGNKIEHRAFADQSPDDALVEAEHATGTIGGFIGLLADRSSHRASLDELNGAAASGWADLPGAAPKA